MSYANSDSLTRRLDHIDASVAHWLARRGVTFLRVSIGVVFLWFGALKLFPGLSPAEGLAGQTILALSRGLIDPAVSVPLLGVWESLIGIGLLTGRALRFTILLLLVHMIGTVTPLVLFPGDMFVREPFVLTFEAQYIIKNLVLVSGALVVGATVRDGRLRSQPSRGRARASTGRGVTPRALGATASRVHAERRVKRWLADDDWVAGKSLIRIDRSA
jgi:uncharacterized membrane protein YkgB